MRPLPFYGQICCGTLEPVAAEQGEASTGVVEVATTSARVERIQGGKKLEYKQWCAEAKYAIEEVKDYHEPTIPENNLQPFSRTVRKRWCLFPRDWHLWLKQMFCCVSVRPRLTNWKLGRDKFCQDFSKGQTNFVSPVRPDPNPSIHGVINQRIKKIKLVFKNLF